MRVRMWDTDDNQHANKVLYVSILKEYLEQRFDEFSLLLIINN